jgi:hypothetical protein
MVVVPVSRLYATSVYSSSHDRQSHLYLPHLSKQKETDPDSRTFSSISFGIHPNVTHQRLYKDTAKTQQYQTIPF